MGTLHLAVNVRFSHLEASPGDWLPAQLVFYFLTLAPHDYVIYCQTRAISGHTSPYGECVCFFWKTPCLFKPMKFISFSRVWTLSGHTWSAAKKFSILNLSPLHPYVKPYLGYIARRWFMLLGNCSQLLGYSSWWSDNELDCLALVRTSSDKFKTALHNGYKALGD